MQPNVVQRKRPPIIPCWWFQAGVKEMQVGRRPPFKN